MEKIFRIGTYFLKIISLRLRFAPPLFFFSLFLFFSSLFSFRALAFARALARASVAGNNNIVNHFHHQFYLSLSFALRCAVFKELPSRSRYLALTGATSSAVLSQLLEKKAGFLAPVDSLFSRLATPHIAYNRPRTEGNQ